jgi:predicted dehydrogenase
MKRQPTAEAECSRRSFVTTAAALVAAPVIGACQSRQKEAAGSPAMASIPPVAGSDTIRIGLIGCGGRGTGAAMQALNADRGAVLTAMGDALADRVESSHQNLHDAMGESASGKIDVPPERRFGGFDAYQKVIDSGVDVVLLVSPPGFRPRHLKAAIDAGKHVFAEKPLAVDSPGLRSVMASAEMARQRNLALCVGFCWRYGDAERAVFQRVNEGAIGEIVTVHTTYHTSTLSKRPRQPEWSDMEWQLRNWWHFTWLSGDHIVEQACHSIDRLAWTTGDRAPLRAIALGGRAARTGAESGNVFDHFAVVYEYDGGMRCFHTCTQIDHTPSDNTDYIYGTSGACIVNGWVPTHLIKDRAGNTLWTYDGPRRDMYQTEHDELFASIRAGTPINDGRTACQSTLMGLMGRMAAYTGQVITWEQAMNSTEDLTPNPCDWATSIPVPPVPVPGQTRFS